VVSEMIYSKWVDNSGLTLNDLIIKIETNAQNAIAGVDDFDNTNLQFEVKKIFDENQYFTIENQDIYFNYFEFQYEYVKRPERSNPVRSKRVGLYNANVIVFAYKRKNYYIIDKGYNDNTLKNLRKMIGYSGKFEISEEQIRGIKTDLFIWLIHYLIDNPESFLDDSEETKIQSVVGFHGSTEDKLAEITGSGEKIMNMLTTLLFLFENQNISKVEATVLRKRERYRLVLGENSHIDINHNYYQGDMVFAIKEEIESKVAIKVFVDVIPKLISIFSNELESKKWTENKENKFFKGIGKSLSKKINEKLRQKS